jgi:hypothetical protein
MINVINTGSMWFGYGCILVLIAIGVSHAFGFLRGYFGDLNYMKKYTIPKIQENIMCHINSESIIIGRLNSMEVRLSELESKRRK